MHSQTLTLAPSYQVIHYALLKPTKEGLYASLPAEVQFIAKPLLDTLIYRCGSLIGAGYFTWAMNAGVTPKFRQFLLLGVTFVWMGNSFWLGILAEREQKAQEEAAAKKAKSESKEML